jgi:hypothetical protein
MAILTKRTLATMAAATLIALAGSLITHQLNPPAGHDNLAAIQAALATNHDNNPTNRDNNPTPADAASQDIGAQQTAILAVNAGPVATSASPSYAGSAVSTNTTVPSITIATGNNNVAIGYAALAAASANNNIYVAATNATYVGGEHVYCWQVADREQALIESPGGVPEELTFAGEAAARVYACADDPALAHGKPTHTLHDLMSGGAPPASER